MSKLIPYEGDLFRLADAFIIHQDPERFAARMGRLERALQPLRRETSEYVQQGLTVQVRDPDRVVQATYSPAQDTYHVVYAKKNGRVPTENDSRLLATMYLKGYGGLQPPVLALNGSVEKELLDEVTDFLVQVDRELCAEK